MKYSLKIEKIICKKFGTKQSKCTILSFKLAELLCSYLIQLAYQKQVIATLGQVVIIYPQWQHTHSHTCTPSANNKYRDPSLTAVYS